MKYFWLIFLTLFIVSCTDRLKQIARDNNEIGESDIRYYADKTVTSLEVPPDLTKPNITDRVDLNTIVDTSDSLISFDDSKEVVRKIENKDITIEVKRNTHQSYLVINKNANYVLNATKNFLKESGFTLQAENSTLGILETNYLENREVLPSSVLNPIRSALQSALGPQYSLPTIDKYRVRIENTSNGGTELYLSISSMREVLVNEGAESENTIWQVKPRDEFIETQMLYQLMVFLGSDNIQAKEKIINAVEQNRIKVTKTTDINGFGKLRLDIPQEEAWEAVAFAIDKLNIVIEDRDRRDGSFYIRTANDDERGLLSAFFGDDAILQSFRIRVKEVENNFSEVYFVDLSGKNEAITKEFSHTLLERIGNAL